ncbi:MAG: aldose epimerase family protein [Succinivibrionaceae bacterium]
MSQNITPKYTSDYPEIFTITGPDGITLDAMAWGATILDLQVPVLGEASRSVLLRLKTLEDWYRQKVAVNAIVGRFANRIANSTFTIDGDTYQLQSRFQHCLHGGDEGFNRRIFHMEKISSDTLECSLLSPDGDMGFPGNFHLKVTYSLAEKSSLLIKFQGKCDKKTYASITSHCYFNLNGCNSPVLDHKIRSSASEYLELASDGIPTGKILKTPGTPFDFREEKTIGKDLNKIPDYQIFQGYDHPLIKPADSPEEFLTLTSGDEKLHMALSSDYPAFQLYTANFMSSPGHEMRAADNSEEYQSHSAVCVEPEYFPDAPHLSAFREINPPVTPQDPLNRYLKLRFY